MTRLTVFGHRRQHALLHHDSRIGLPVALGRILKSRAEKARVERQRCGFRWEQIGPAEAGIALPGVAAGGRRHRPEANTLADHLGHLLVDRFGLELALPERRYAGIGGRQARPVLAVGFGVERDAQTAEHVQFLAVRFERFQLDRHFVIGSSRLGNPQRGGETAAPEEGIEARGQRPAAGLSLTFTVQETVEEGQAHDGQSALACAAEKRSAIEFHQVLLYFNATSFEVSGGWVFAGGAAV